MPVSIWNDLIAHLQSSLPNEGCGLLAGPTNQSGDLNVTQYYPGRNELESPSRFRMDPVEVVASFRLMRDANLQLLAIAHSHPTTRANPSRTDRNEANYPEAVMLIVSFASGDAEAVAWRVPVDKSVPPHRITLSVDGIP